jgi:hypothetical protein
MSVISVTSAVDSFLYTIRLYTIRLYTIRLYTIRLYTIRLYTIRLYTIRIDKERREESMVLGTALFRITERGSLLPPAKTAAVETRHGFSDAKRTNPYLSVATVF